MQYNHSVQNIRKAIILAGGQKTNLTPLNNYFPVCMLPILNRPLLDFTVDFLKKNSIEEIYISISKDDEIHPEFKGYNSPEVKIHLHVEDKPRGTAGAIKDLEEFIGAEPFIVINSNTLIRDINFSNAIEFFNKTNSALIVGIRKKHKSKRTSEKVKVSRSSTVSSIHLLHSSMDRRSPWTSNGIYIFDPMVFDHISSSGYVDIKEQLIPALQRESLIISAFEIEGNYHCIDNVNDYMNVQRNILLENSSTSLHTEGKEEVADKVWVGKDVKISPRAYLLGPLVIGDRCRIEDSAQLIGPAVIGSKCQISRNSLVRESILCDDIVLEKDSKVEYSIILKGTDIPTRLNIRNMIAIDGMSIGDANLIPSDLNIKGIADLSGLASISGTTHRIYKTAKRVLDLVLSVFGLVVFSPLFLLIAAAVKFDSRGPLFYIQKRCGTGGKLFGMIKFRTMVADAEKLHTDLLSQQDTDGPMFKMMFDPRITRTGNFLRKTSLDEIPQLINVLRGDMSLVGPRPLIMEEMKFSPSWRDTRLKVKPGITGLWQIQGRSEASFHDWVRYDINYVRNQSMLLDLKILFKTIKVVLKKSGAY